MLGLFGRMEQSMRCPGETRAAATCTTTYGGQGEEITYPRMLFVIPFTNGDLQVGDVNRLEPVDKESV